MGVNADDLGKLVVARTGDGMHQGIGLMETYADHPTVQIRGPNGVTFRWPASLCNVVDVPKEAVAEIMDATKMPLNACHMCRRPLPPPNPDQSQG